MRLALLSDVHSNLDALDAVLATIDERGADAVYCLGDVVGYNADAAACVDRIRAVCDGVVRGNHDEAVAAGRGVLMLPKDAQLAARHNASQLSGEQKAWLNDLPLALQVENATLVHATPEAPHAWLRMDSYTVAQAQFQHFTTDVCFAGHTHLPAIMANRLGVLSVRPGHRYLINVGSVGQPRDGDPRACVAFFDTETFAYELVRVPYYVEHAAEKILGAGLPRSLARRLEAGR